MSHYKLCPRCKQTLSLDNFSFPDATRGIPTFCKPCAESHYAKLRVSQSHDGIKRCSKCKLDLPATSEYFGSRKRSPDGFMEVCRSCKNKTSKRIGVTPDVRICKKCGIEKPNTVEYFTLSKDGHPSSPCCDCIAIKKKEWRKNNPEVVKKHKSESQKRNRPAANARTRKHSKLHPEKANIRCHRRLARIHELPFAFTDDDWRRCLKYWGNMCCVCGRQADDSLQIAKDHWIALKDDRPDNPGTVPANIVPLCHTRKGAKWGCNNKKNNRDAREWLISEYGEQQADATIARIAAYFASLD